VRVERVQDISVHDARSEGFDAGDVAALMLAADNAEADQWAMAKHRGFFQREIDDGESGLVLAVYWFRDLWDAINAKRGFPWALNPWVWAINFKVINA